MRKSTVLLCLTVLLAAICAIGALAFRPASAPLRSDGYYRGSSAYATQDAFTLAAGRRATKPAGLIAIQSNGETPRFVDFIPNGSGAAGTTFDYKLWVVSVSYTENGTIDDYDLQLFCSGTATLSASAGVGSYSITSAEKVCDGLTVTNAGTYGEKLVDAFGGVDPLVFTGSAGATLFCPDIGSVYGFVFETDLTGASSAGYLYRLGV